MVVGTSTATCLPSRQALNAARMATSVLPKPTSPHTSRSMGAGRFHIFFHIGRGPALVGSIFINKRSFQFRLEIIIRRKSKSLLGLAGRIEFDQVKSNFLNAGFCFFFQFLPGITAEFTYFRNTSFPARIF